MTKAEKPAKGFEACLAKISGQMASGQLKIRLEVEEDPPGLEV